MEDTANKKSFVRGAAILAAAVFISKVVGAVYKLPLYNMLGSAGTTTFTIIYTIYSLLLTIATAGIPIALSRLVSAAIATDRRAQAKRYYKVAMPAFILIGIVCMIVMLLFAKQMAAFMGVKEAEPGIRVLAPAVFFSCVVAVYRGYTQGFEDMTPTAVSQVIEVIFKMIFGLGVVYIFVKRGFDEATTTAGAIVGAVVGMGLSVPAMMYYKKRSDNTLRLMGEPTDAPASPSDTLRELMKVSIPITASILILNVVLLINTKVIIARLQTGSGFSYEEAKDLEGVRSMAMTLFNLPSAFIVPITTSVVPAISAALAERRPKGARRIMESALKLTNLLAMPAGVGIAALANPIFNGLYWGNNQIGVKLMFILGFAAYFICLQLMTTAILQAAGHERLSMLTLPVGCIVQVIVVYILTGIRSISIVGASVGTTTCYVLISALNIWFMKKRIPVAPRVLRTFIKPLFCSVVMGVAAWACYGILGKLLPRLPASRVGTLVLLVAAIAVGVVVYAVLVVFIGAISRSDLKFFPKGDKIARLLHIQ